MSMPVLRLALPAMAFATASLAATPIGDLVKNPDAFANQTATVEGKVTTQTISYGADATYTLQGADDYRITVIAHGPAPAPGTALSVTGTVGRRPPDEEFDFPPVIIESSRTPQ